jgi:acetaldehyde dehydrogenase (acetylating)
MQFGLEKPVFRILVNTMGTLGSVGLTTELMPAMTLGSGGIGGSISGDNITTTHLLNIKRLAYETGSPPAEAMVKAATVSSVAEPAPANTGGLSQAHVEEIVRRVLQEVRQ